MVESLPYHLSKERKKFAGERGITNNLACRLSSPSTRREILSLLLGRSDRVSFVWNHLSPSPSPSFSFRVWEQLEAEKEFRLGDLNYIHRAMRGDDRRDARTVTECTSHWRLKTAYCSKRGTVSRETSTACKTGRQLPYGLDFA